ncbi:uncharacterized protein JCM10292_004662 [Rhodotorula paludigena]|uniref:uncharacterized protein n=1 Tax=Rhodotorula paludigena TaxID=86838 RepID=UPI00318179FB
MDRPALSVSTAGPPLRRPSVRRGSDSPALVSSPLSAHPPITPQNQHSFFDSYFDAATASGLQTPPIGAQASLFPGAAGGGFPGRRGLLRRNSSLSSVSSSVMDEEDAEDEPEWTAQEEEQVRRIYDACLAKHALTEAPFPAHGVPPSNFTNLVARTIMRTAAGGDNTRRSARARKPHFFAAGGDDVDMGAVDEQAATAGGKWPHGLRSTRLKILALAKDRQLAATAEETPRQAADPDATPRRRKPLARQDSMDFLPDVHNTGSIARLSNMFRQGSQDGGLPGSISGSRTPPIGAAASLQQQQQPALGALGVPLVRSASSRPSYRMQRTNSLQSIVGSPSQPVKPRRKASATNGVNNTLLTVPSASAPANKPAASLGMSRTGSESSVLPARPLARHLSFSGASDSATESSGERAPLGSTVSPTKKSGLAAPSLGLLTPPSSAASKKRAQTAFVFASASPSASSRNPLGLTLDPAAAAAMSHKRDGGAAGLASAFSSPVIGAYPSPTSASPQKRKKAKVAAAAAVTAAGGPSPVKQPSFGLAPPLEAQEPAVQGAGLGLGLGIGGLNALTADASGLSSSAENDKSPFLVRPPLAQASSSSSPMARDRTPSGDGMSLSPTFTLLDPSASPSSLASRRNSPPKISLTPSLSPSSSFTSTASSSFASLCASSSVTSAGSASSQPGTPSPLSPLFDLNALKLESLTPSPAESLASASSDESDFGCAGASHAMLDEAYVRAGHEAQMLRTQLGTWAWDRQ